MDFRLEQEQVEVLQQIKVLVDKNKNADPEGILESMWNFVDYSKAGKLLARAFDCQLKDSSVNTLMSMVAVFEAWTARTKREERQQKQKNEEEACSQRLLEIRQEADNGVLPRLTDLVRTGFPALGPSDACEYKRLCAHAMSSSSKFLELMEAAQTLATSGFLEKAEMSLETLKQSCVSLEAFVQCELGEIRKMEEMHRLRDNARRLEEEKDHQQKEPANRERIFTEEQLTLQKHHEELEKEAAMALQRIDIMSRERMKTLQNDEYNQSLRDKLEYQRKATMKQESDEKKWTEQLFTQGLEEPKSKEKIGDGSKKLATAQKLKTDVKRLKRLQKERAAAKKKEGEKAALSKRRARDVAIQRERDIATAKFHDERLRQEKRLRDKREEETQKEENIQKARDDVDEGDDDTENEKSLRLNARRILKEYREAGKAAGTCSVIKAHLMVKSVVPTSRS